MSSSARILSSHFWMGGQCKHHWHLDLNVSVPLPSVCPLHPSQTLLFLCGPSLKALVVPGLSDTWDHVDQQPAAEEEEKKKKLSWCKHFDPLNKTSHYDLLRHRRQTWINLRLWVLLQAENITATAGKIEILIWVSLEHFVQNAHDFWRNYTLLLCARCLGILSSVKW